MDANVHIGYYLFALVIVFIIIISAINSYRKKVFIYPYITNDIDIFRKRNPSYEDCIDQWIIDNNIRSHDDFKKIFDNMLSEWEKHCENIIKKSLWKKHRSDVYNKMHQEVVNENYLAFEFVFKGWYVGKCEWRSLNQLYEIIDELSEIDFQTTRKKYNEANQRKLMTPELRERIKKRDNYTCQICGRYMPDEFGLEIDHIIPVSKGGRTVESNLQVLCCSCNRKKGSKSTLEQQPYVKEVTFEELFE